MLIFFSKYYEKEALTADPDYGTILSSLLGKIYFISFYLIHNKLFNLISVWQKAVGKFIFYLPMFG